MAFRPLTPTASAMLGPTCAPPSAGYTASITSDVAPLLASSSVRKEPLGETSMGGSETCTSYGPALLSAHVSKLTVNVTMPFTAVPSSGSRAGTSSVRVVANEDATSRTSDMGITLHDSVVV